MEGSSSELSSPGEENLRGEGSLSEGEKEPVQHPRWAGRQAGRQARQPEAQATAEAGDWLPLCGALLEFISPRVLPFWFLLV